MIMKLLMAGVIELVTMKEMLLEENLKDLVSHIQTLLILSAD